MPITRIRCWYSNQYAMNILPFYDLDGHVQALRRQKLVETMAWKL
jgi:hypothetical protein